MASQAQNRIVNLPWISAVQERNRSCGWLFWPCLLLATGAAAQPAPPVVSAPATTAAPAANGPSNLNVTPRRAIFEGTKRTDAIYVFNQGSEQITVDVSLVDNVMLPSGEIVPVDTIGEKGPAAAAAATRLQSARDMILATPSRLVLSPGVGKTIRLRANAPASGTGEYRTHLKVATLPSADLGLTAEQAAAAGRGEMVMRVQALFGITIPLIVRAGGASATAAFGPITLEREKLPAADGAPARDVAVLVLPLRRAGTASVYGNIEVRSGAGRNGEMVGLVRGIAVYPELEERLVRIRLVRDLRIGETVNLFFAADEGKAGNDLARGSFTAP